MDVALPDTMLVGELLPHLLRHAGEDMADEGERHGGWVMHRATGAALEPNRNLSVQGVRDGELLHLVPGRLDWPELAYDDVVEIIASGARRTGRSWGKLATRRCGLATGATAMSVARVSEISSTSENSFEDAMQQGISRANKTLRNVKGAWIKEQQLDIENGKVTRYQVNMLVTFVLDD